MDELDDLLRRAADADGLTRMEFRDPIAAFGEAAILRLEPWLGDARLGAFAVRTIGRAAVQRGAVAAARAVFGRARGGCVDSVRGDIDAILATFSPARWSPSAHRRPVARRGVVRLIPPPQALRDLVARWRADGSPPQDAIPWRRELWLRDLREHPRLRRHEGLLRALPTYLDRAAVRAVCVNASSDAPSAERALVAVMAWGQGENGYGPYRTREILSVEDASDRLWMAARTLDADGPLAAYRCLSDRGGCRLDGLGPAFGTKYLYFCQPGSPRPTALILDKLLCNWLATNAELDLKSQPWSEPTYTAYLAQMHAWADELSCAPEDVEMCIFRATAPPGSQWAARQRLTVISETPTRAP